MLQNYGGDHRFVLRLSLTSHWALEFLSHYDRNRSPEQPCRITVVLRGLRNLYYYGHIEGRPAARAPLAGSHAWLFAPDFDVSGHGMGAHRAVNLPHRMIDWE